ncbi:transmembrane [Brachionus plicatilis]|uniref:Transmembrane (Macronuclear) n=1 Tax=Brachionus plicatilis TaxID=10195 RepID=A0A3M7QG20_BRAPC|nr:transmembrane [Brachionus plicatilis]
MYKIITILAIFFSSVFCSKISDVIPELKLKLYDYQIKQSQSYKPPFKWAEKAGLFKSDIRVNFVGSPIMSELRNGKLTSIFDNDMFSTGWIFSALFDRSLYALDVPDVYYYPLENGLKAMNDYQNKNENQSRTTPIRTFWPQIYNKTYDIWQQQPDNIRNLILNIEKLPWNQIEKFLRTLHLDKIADALQEIIDEGHTAIKAFQIPSDFDDTYLNVGIGSALFRLSKSYGSLYNEWSKKNSNFYELIEKTAQYAYRPFENSDQSIIDPRTYFYARPFILEAEKNNQSLALITTWIQNIGEQRTRQKKGVSMPFNVNNIDVTVCANSIYGITDAAIIDLNGFQQMFVKSDQIQQIYLNTTKFISWAIQTNFTKRPDLAQVYYPSTYNFLWYTSRTLFLLENEFRSSSVPKSIGDVLTEAKSYLSKALEKEATNFFLAKAQRDHEGHIFFEDFLGVDDTDIFGKKSSTGEDRIFSTSQAINTLLYTWTFYDQASKKLQWKENVSANVKDLVRSSITWLSKNVLSKNLKPLNSFFSGSVKGFTSLPFWYPANFLQYLNGTDVDPNNLDEKDFEDVIFGVKGTIDENVYQKLLHVPHFGQMTPIDFNGYNEKGEFFPFWSSEPYTYSVSLLALSLFK